MTTTSNGDAWWLVLACAGCGMSATACDRARHVHTGRGALPGVSDRGRLLGQ